MTTPRSTTPSGVTPPGRDRFGLSNPARRTGTGFGAIGAVAGVLLIALVVGGIVWAAATGSAPASQKPRIFGGSLVLDDYRPLTVIDLATGEVTVQLEGVYTQVGASNYGQVQAVPTGGGRRWSTGGRARSTCSAMTITSWGHLTMEFLSVL
jgi:hypothetical protein